MIARARMHDARIGTKFSASLHMLYHRRRVYAKWTPPRRFFIDIEEGFCSNNFPGIELYGYGQVHDHD